MKKVLLTLLVTTISCGLITSATAQTEEQRVKTKTLSETVKDTARNEKMMPTPEVQLERLTKGLQLTDEQQKQIRPLLEAEYAKLKEIRVDDDLSPKQIKKKVEELRTETIAKMQSYMTPEQKEKHDLISREIKAYTETRIKENRKSRIDTKTDPSQQPNR